MDDHHHDDDATRRDDATASAAAAASAAVTKAAKATFSRRRQLFVFCRSSLLFSENCRGSEGLVGTSCALRYDKYRTNRGVARFVMMVYIRVVVR